MGTYHRLPPKYSVTLILLVQYSRNTDPFIVDLAIILYLVPAA